MDADRDHQAGAQADSLANHVQMAIGNGVEGAGIKRDTGHKSVLPCPARARKPNRFPVVPAIGEYWFFYRPLNYFRGSPRPGEAALFRRPAGDETKLRGNETTFAQREAIQKRLLCMA